MLGCTNQIAYEAAYEGCNTELKKCLGQERNCPPCICPNITIPPCPKYNNTQSYAKVCSNKTYLSLEQYQSMSIRIKSCEKKLTRVNGTDYINNLYSNYTKCMRNLNETNRTLQTIYNLTKTYIVKS